MSEPMQTFGTRNRAVAIGVSTAILATLAATLPPPAAASPGQNILVSVSSAGTQGNGTSGLGVTSADGSVVAFSSTATNLVPGDTNAGSGDVRPADIFVRDRTAGTTTRVNVSTTGAEANGFSGAPAISADGTIVVFDSNADTLVPGDTNGRNDVFLHDRSLGTTTRISVGIAGAESDGHSGQPDISADGTLVAFYSRATNLVAGTDANGAAADIFVLDRTTGATSRVSRSSAGVQGNENSLDPALSADGNVVAFESDATNLVAGDTNQTTDVFVHDRASGTTSRVSVDSAGGQSANVSPDPFDAGNYEPDIDGDGDVVSFISDATNLVPDDRNDRLDVFVHDRADRTTKRVSVSGTGAEADNASFRHSIDDSGTRVVFSSTASNLVPGDTNSAPDVFLHDLATGAVTRENVTSDGGQVAFGAANPHISPDGGFVAFDAGRPYVPGDVNGVGDVYLHQLPGTSEATTTTTATAATSTTTSTSSPYPDTRLSRQSGTPGTRFAARTSGVDPGKQYTLFFADAARLANGACHQVGTKAGDPVLSGPDGTIAFTAGTVPVNASAGSGQVCFALKNNRANHSDAATFYVF